MAAEAGVRPTAGGLGTIETWLGGRGQYVDAIVERAGGGPHRRGRS